MKPHTPTAHEATHVKLYECEHHGCFHLCIGKVSIHLTHRELLLLGGAIDKWWTEHPEQLGRVEAFDFLKP